ncbi:MAG: LLM class flavin-dependent oxidoreductase [Nitrososphaerales archaeon]
MNCGIAISWRGATIEATREICIAADRLGFQYLWITEAWGLEALTTTGYLLGLSNQIKIGAGVLNVYSRSAALIGMACATLDQISAGRFLLGLGTSGRTLVEHWHGVKFESPNIRVREYMEVIRRVLRGENVEFDGEAMKLSGFKLYSKPSKEQEIYLGAMGDRNLRLAGEICEGAIVTMYPLSKLHHASELVNGKSNGRKKKIFSYLQLRVTANADEIEKARREVAKNIAFYVASMGTYYAKNLAKLGFASEVKKITEAHSAGGSKRATEEVDDALIDELSVIGSLAEIKEKLCKIPDTVIPVFVVDAPPSLKISDLHLDQLKLVLQR